MSPEFLSSSKAMRKHEYLYSIVHKFERKHKNIIREYELHTQRYEKFMKTGYVYVYCSKCNKTFIIPFADYITAPDKYNFGNKTNSTWVCHTCEEKIIKDAMKNPHTSVPVKSFPCVDRLTFTNGTMMFVGRFNDGVHITYADGGKKYGV